MFPVMASSISSSVGCGFSRSSTAAVLTPTPDPFTMCLLAVPMIALYELGILLIGRNKAVDHASVAG